MQREAQQGNQEALNEDSNASVGAVILQDMAQQARLTANPLPKIPYDKKRLDSLIKKIPLAPNNQIVVDGYLKNIEDRISDIHNWQEDEYIEDCYEAMQLALVEIRNTANALCNLIAKYDTLGGFANKLKKILEELTAPLSKELEKRLVPKDEKAALELKTKRLYAAQSFIETNQVLQNALKQQLERVKTLSKQPGKPTPRCYISYAWPSRENQAQEYWVQPFLYILCEHLRSAGINIIMDVRDNKPGDSIFGFMDQYNDGNYIILIGTPSLLEKHKSYKNHAVKIELNIINNRFEKDHELHGKSRIYPLLISGTIQTSYPDMYDKYRTVKDCKDNGYLSLIEHLTQWLYGELINKDERLEAEYLSSWVELHNLYQSQQGLGSDTQIARIEMEISKDYHRQRLQQLRQRPQYRSVEAQQEITYSATFAKEEIALKMRAIGINPQTLFDATGQQFQRPQAIPNFIERRALWNKMTQYFDSPEQQILSLTAQGLGGVGKSSLAAHYCLHPPRPYELRAWLNAGSRTQLSLDYITLAKEIGGMEFDKKEPIEKQVQLVLKWLEGQADCLLVYDNVPNAKEIEGLLPQQGRHHILITSRNSVDWPPQQSLDVDIMEEIEAIDLIVNMTGHDKDKNIDALKESVKVLGYIPLALVQAGAYIREHSNDIKKYLDIYQEKKYNNQEELLKYISEVSDATKHEPIWITFDINFDALKKDYPLALATLKQASWLSHANIPEDLLFNMMQVDDEARDKRLWWDDINKYIKRYSLMRIDAELHLMSIHPVLQDILRSKQNKTEQIGTFKEMCLGLGLLFIYSDKNNLQYRGLLPHAERLHKHGQKIAQLAKASGIKDGQLSLVEPDCLEYIYLSLGLTKKALNFLTKKKEIYENHYGCNHVEMITTLKNLGTAYRMLGEFEKARQYFELALKISEDQYGKGHAETVDILGEIGNIYRVLGRFEEARQYCEQALKISDVCYGQSYVGAADSLRSLGGVCLSLGKFEEARRYFERALNIRYGYYSGDHVDMAADLECLGHVSIKLGKIKEAEQYYVKSLAIREAHYGKGHVQTTDVLGSLGNFYRLLGRFKEAERYCLNALNIQESHYSGGHIDKSVNLGNLGTIYTLLGKPDKAIDYYVKALKINEDHYGKGHLETASHLGNLGFGFLRLGKYQEAIQYYGMAIKIREPHYDKGHIGIAIDLGNFGHACLSLGHLMEAKQYFERSLHIQESHYEGGHIECTLNLKGLGRVYQQLGETEKAIQYFEQSLKISQAHYGKGHIETVNELTHLGSIYLQQGSLETAKNYLLRAKEICSQPYSPEGHQYLETIENLLKNLAEPSATQSYTAATSQTKKFNAKANARIVFEAKQKILETSNELCQQGTYYYQAKEYINALGFFQKALSIQQGDKVPWSAAIATLNYNIGSTYFSMQNYEQALSHLHTAFDIRVQLLDPDDEKTLKAKNRLEECKALLQRGGRMTQETSPKSTNKLKNFMQ